MAERFIPLALVWLLVLGQISLALHATVPALLDLWREQTAAVAARLRVLAEMPLLPEPCVRDLLRRASGKHRRRPLPSWLRKAVSS